MEWNNFENDFTAHINEKINEFSIPGKLIAELLGISETSVKYKRSGRSPWLIQEASLLALYFGKTLDELTFGDKDFVIKTTQSFLKEKNNELKRFLIEKGHSNILGKLIAEGYFKE